MNNTIIGKVSLEAKARKLKPNEWEADMQHIRIIGCDDTRQCEVKYESGVLFFKERNNDGHYVAVDMDQMFRRIFVTLIKSNDGMPLKEAVDNGLRALPGYEYVTVAEEQHNEE